MQDLITQKRIKIVITVATGLFFAWAIIMTIFDMSGKVEHSNATTITTVLAVVGATQLVKTIIKSD